MSDSELLCRVSGSEFTISDKELFDRISGDFERQISRMTSNIDCRDDDALVASSIVMERYADFLLSQRMPVSAIEQIEDAIRIVKCSENVYSVDERLPDDTMTIFGNKPAFHSRTVYSSKIRMRIDCLKSRYTELIDKFGHLRTEQ